MASDSLNTRVDELTPIAVYIEHEMNANARGRDGRRMAELNAFSSEACINEYIRASFWRKLFGTIKPEQCMNMAISSHQAALLMWTVKVMQDSDWDHKPKIRAKFISRVSHTGVWHAYDDKLYFYDIWSNVHYGYVGAAVGFDESTLLDGAGLEQIGTDLLRRRWPIRTGGLDGLRAFDDASDRAAITIGIELYGDYPQHVSHAAILERVLNDPDLTTKPVP